MRETSGWKSISAPGWARLVCSSLEYDPTYIMLLYSNTYFLVYSRVSTKSDLMSVQRGSVNVIELITLSYGNQTVQIPTYTGLKTRSPSYFSKY